ncbi:MAG: hypothetical protein J1D77_03965 [Muribaculaceae bacterium]|nr:hypothetical protein [Muribaculaceae bacterium]
MWKRNILFVLILSVAFTAMVAKKKPDKNPALVDVENKVLAVTGADLIIGTNKVTGSSTWILNFLSPTELEVRKKNLLQKVCKKVGADVIISPEFTYSRNILGGGKLTVTGYPANYNNFRSLSRSEIDSLIYGTPDDDDKVYFINKSSLE